MPAKKKSYSYPYPRPSVTVDLVAFTFRHKEMHVLMVRRRSPPFEGMLAFPGGYLEMDEEPVDAVCRETREETGLALMGPVVELSFYGAIDRDPRGRTISLVHVAMIRGPAPDPIGGDDAAEASWVPLNVLITKELAFDHALILQEAVEWLDSMTVPAASLLAFLPEIFEVADVKALAKYLGWPMTVVESWCEEAVARDLCERLPGRKKRFRSLVEDAADFQRLDVKE
jgi:8-oxo-dGTP diphosphatase